ncbi:MAG: DUF1569 domain-containing protein [Bacteroidota bacterium]
MTNIFEAETTNTLLSRIEQLQDTSEPQWGKMNVAQMLAHCNVSYDMVYTDKYPKPGAFQKFIIKMLAKKAVVGPKPYPKNARTAPEFLITDERDFETEKTALIQNLNKTQELGANYFDNRESHAFEKLSVKEWSTLFHKHLDHHLTQFGV